MNTLIERIEALTAPCREVDGLIAIATGCILEKRNKDRQEWYYRPNGDRWSSNTYGYSFNAMPRYTASIDAAMTLVPEKWTAWELCSRGDKTRFYAEITRLVDDQQEYAYGRSSTPAIALCIAALKAREATNA